MVYLSIITNMFKILVNDFVKNNRHVQASSGEVEEKFKKNKKNK
jgi:hypothetical protein